MLEFYPVLLIPKLIFQGPEDYELMIEVMKKRKLDVFTIHFIESMNLMNLSTEYL